MQKLVLAAAGALLVVLSGCATLVGDEAQVVPIASTPPGASVTVTDESGRVVYRGKTPATLSMKKSTGKYWGGKSYRVTVAKSGYTSKTYALTTSPNGWYLAGNFLISGGLGWFLVDPFSGQMYSLSPDRLDAQLGRLLPDVPPVPGHPTAATVAPAPAPTLIPAAPPAAGPVAIPAAAPAPVSPVAVPLPDGMPVATPSDEASPEAPVKEVPAAEKRKQEVEKAIDAAPQGDFGVSETLRQLSPGTSRADSPGAAGTAAPAVAPTSVPEATGTPPASEPSSSAPTDAPSSALIAPAAPPPVPDRPPAPPPASANPW